MVECCAATELNIVGKTTYKPLIYSYGSNNPRTASTGGLIGALRDSSAEGYSLVNSSVTNIHVVGRAYIQSQTGMVNDIYVGGAVGVAGGTDNDAVSNISGITVEDTAIESVGESAMLTYAGGIFGGVWWTADIPTSNLISRNNTVLASSASYSTYAGGISGMIQNNQNYNITNISSAKVLNTSVEAVTYGSGSSGSVTIKAYAAGICPRICQYSYIENSVSNAVVSASGNTTVLAGIGIFSMGEGFDIANDNSRNNYFVAANVRETNGMTSAYAFRYTNGNPYSTTEQNNYAVALTHSDENVVGNNATTIETLESGDDLSVYNGAGLDFSGENVSNNSINGIDAAGNKVTVKVIGNSITLQKNGSNLRVIPASGVTGTSYVQILIGEDILCSYAVTVPPATTSGEVNVYDNNSYDSTTGSYTPVSNSNSHNYATGNVTGSYGHIDFTQGGNIGDILQSPFTEVKTSASKTVTADDDTRYSLRLGGKVSENDNYLKFEIDSSVTSFSITVEMRANRTNASFYPVVYGYTTQNETTSFTLIKAAEDETLNFFSRTITISLSNEDIKDVIYKNGKKDFYFGTSSNGSRIYSVSIDVVSTCEHVDNDSDGKCDNCGADMSWNGKYEYFQVYAGESSDFVQEVLITYANTSPYIPSIYFVTDEIWKNNSISLTLPGYVGDVDEEIKQENALKILNNRGDPVEPGEIKEYFTTTQLSNGYVYVSPVLGKSEGAAIVLQYNTGDGPHYVIIEAVPNAIEGITVTPSEDTPPYATHEVEVEGGKETHHIYSAGDTVLLESDVDYRFDYNRFIVDVEYELGVVYDENGNQSDSLRNFITVQPNGTVIIGDGENAVPSGTRFTVICYDVNDENNTAKQGTIILEVRTDIDVESRDLTGANYAPVADNHAIIGEEFSFTVSPRPGYGLNPEVTLDLYNGSTQIGTITLIFEEERADSFGTPKIVLSSGLTGNYTITYIYDAQTGRYTITLGADVTEISNLNKIYIDAVFQKVYTIMFDLGTWADDDGGLRYYTYTVKNGTDINSELYNSIVKTIATGNEGSENRINERAGFTFKGFYLTSIASSESAYQQSFEDRFNKETATEQVRGSINYYARWNYTVVLNAPESVGIESGLASSLLEKELYDYGAENQDEATSPNNIIPIDTMHGFSFSLTGGYVGTPRVEVYTVAVINGENVLNALAFTESGGVYTISNPDDITGTIYIYVYPDNIAVGVGETDTGSSFSTDIDLREDGIFTVRYVINHGADDTTLGNTAVFNFSENLPVGTRIRLFYQQDSTPKAVGEYVVVGQNGVRSVKASAFGALPGSGTIPDGKVAGVGSETYYLVITLPNNDGNNFDNADGAVELTVRVAAQGIAGLTQNSYETKAHVIPDENGNTGGAAQSKIQDVELGESQNETLSATVNMYGAIIREGSLSGSILSFVPTDNGGGNAPADVRHQSKFYVWRIVKDEWNSENNGVKISGTASGAVVTTDNYVYVLADNKLTVSGTYTVELMEVTNTQYPAAGVVIWRSGSGN